MRLPPLPALPIDSALPALTAALVASTRVVLQAPPGAGKSTKVPLELLTSPWLGMRKLLMLEPRRIAARAVATRMAGLLGEPVGRTVGYRTRLDTRIGRETRIEVVTEGILTRMLQHDAALGDVGGVIFDEFHERSIHADLSLALALESQATLREDLRLLVMSATLDTDALATLLGSAPVIQSAGASFDVVTHYLPRRTDLSLEQHMATAIRRALAAHEGDLLCFLPGAAEIARVQRALEPDAGAPGVRLVPLYGELSAAAQDAALQPAPPGTRKVVLATSIAETSLTIDGIRVVIDAGLRRFSAFDPNTGMSRLVTAKVSQSAADQRRGRAGRLAPGVCYRLWSEGVHATLSPQTAPEILQADLAPLALELACWGAPGGQGLAWLDPPPAATLSTATDLLRRLDAVDLQGRITPHGRALAGMGTHPRLAHMRLEAGALSAARLGAELAALLSERDILRAAPGRRDVDLRLRVAALRGDTAALPPHMGIDARTLSLVRRSALEWQRELPPGPDGADPHTATGQLLALAYPDRIGRTRGGGGRYLLVNGRGARFAEPQALAKSEFIVAAELDGADREARIFLAAPVRLADLEALQGAAIEEKADIAWDDHHEMIVARRERRLGAVVLEAAELRDPDPAALEAAALTGLTRLGVAALPWTRELRQWQSRLGFLRALEVAAPAPWPDLSDAALTATLKEWAPPWIAGFTRREHAARIDLGAALRCRLSFMQHEILEREAPTHFVVPSGSRIPIDYLDGDVPTLSVRLQEMFGLTTTPRVAAGRLPLLLKLLSPAGRPVQITRDLVSFWSRGYHEVRKDLKGRYPKHYWPDDPYTAAPTGRARPR